MAELLGQEKSHSEALVLFDQAVEQRKHFHGKKHEQTHSAQNGLALLYSQSGDYKRALKLYEEILKNQPEVVGDEVPNPSILAVKHNKAGALLKDGRLEEGMALLEQNYQHYLNLFGGEHPDTLTTLDWIAMGLDKQEKFQESLGKFSEVYETRKIVLGAKHPETIQTQLQMQRLRRKLEEL